METNVKAVELKELWRRCKEEGDERARERLVVAYSPLVKYVAGRMAAGLPSHVEEGDLISYGLIGLIGSIERYDLDREIKFETFAVSRIRARSSTSCARSTGCRARSARRPATSRRSTRSSRTSSAAHRARRRWPTSSASPSTTSATTLLEIANSSVLALDDLWTVADPDGGQVSLLDTIRDPNAVDPEEAIDTVELKDRLADAIESLPDRERLVIALYYYETLTLREIGDVLGVTESRVSQLHTKAVLGMRSHLQNAA